MNELVDAGFLKGAKKLTGEDDGDASALDLRPKAKGYKLLNGSVKPAGGKYIQDLETKNLVEPLTFDDQGVVTLEQRSTYLFQTEESLVANLIENSPIYGQATAKSSVGRVDVLARLIVDGMSSYEEFTPEGVKKGSGSMYIEVTPLTFPVKVKAGEPLTQLRFFYGAPGDSEVRGPHLFRSILNNRTIDEPLLTLDLSHETKGDKQGCAFRAKDGDGLDPVCLWKLEECPNPVTYWELMPVGEHNRFIIGPDKFYILRSKEKIAVPKGIAVYCRAIDETIGEIRIHYAGFVHPHFGTKRQDGQDGAPLIFEVRGHNVKANLRDGEVLARLIFYRMSEDAGEGKSPYSNQSLTLSGFFANWPAASAVLPEANND